MDAPAPRRGRDDELLHLLVENVTDYAVYTLDLDGHVRTWNRGAERLKGYRPDEIIGKHFSRFYLDEDVADGKPDRELAIAAAEGRYEEEGWRVRQDGELFWANVTITALRGDDGRLLGFGKVTRDLTERKRGDDALRESEERFRLLVTGVNDYAIFLLNTDGTVASWNSGAERLKGYRADEIIGQHFSRFYTAEERRAGVPESGLQQAFEQGRWESEGWRVRKDGSRFWANVIITSLRGNDGRHRGFAKVTRDLTERKRNEDALRGVLERERDAAAKLRELDRMKTDLVAIVAHDLRAPVGVIQGFVHLLRKDWSELPDDEKLELVDRVAARAESLGGLVDDLFDLARIEAGELSVDALPFDVGAAVTSAVDDVSAVASGRRIVIDAGTATATATGDERRTWQVLTNLLTNALKFSPPDSPVEVTVRPAGDEVVVAVADCGPGIPAEHLGLLFQRFVRLPQSEGTPGSGMGLFIAKSLAEAQGGRVEVESVPGQGSTFRLVLPAHRPSP